MEYNLDQVIELMRRCYRNPIDLNSLVIGSFPNLQGLLTPGAGIYQNINELVPAIDAKGEIEKLLTRIKAKYPKPYQEYESKLFVNDHYDDELVNPPKEDDNISPPKKIEPESKTPPEKTGICDILVLSANSNRKLDLDGEIKLIEEEAKGFTIKLIEDAYIDDLSKYLAESQPLILHFSGHGNSRGEIILNKRNKSGEAETEVLSMEELAKLLSKYQVQCVVLNACFSGHKLDALKDSVSCVIGMNKEIDDKSAKKFAEGFYRGVGRRVTYADAFEEGKSQIILLRLPDSDVPHFIPRDASVLNLKPTRTRSVPEQKHLPSYPLWFGTNRKPIDLQDLSKGFSHERDNQLHYGNCQVIVPESHQIASIGYPHWQNLLMFKFCDDRLKLQHDTLKELPENIFWSHVKEKIKEYQEIEPYALIFIHGYNVSFEDAALKAAQLGCDLRIPPGMMAFYSWPSQGKFEGYPADGATIEASEKYIYQFLMGWIEQKEIKKVHIIAHSMGNRGLLRVMQRILAEVQTDRKIPFGQIFLAAPDVDPDLFRDLAEVYRKLSEKTTLYVSAKDGALKASGFLHNYRRLGFCSYDSLKNIVKDISIVEDIDTVEVSDIDLSLLGHGYYGDSQYLLEDIGQLLQHNQPSDKRNSATFNNQNYWSIRR